MTFFYLATFIGGLLVAVWVMMHGVERPRDAHPAGERSFSVSPAIAIACAIVKSQVGAILPAEQP